MAASGTTKKITSNQILGAGGTATLASATITGDLTVRTNKLAVTSTGVGFGTTSPNASFQATLSGLYGLRIQSADTNNSALNIGNDPASGYAFVDATKDGSGSFLPLRFSTSDTERIRISTAGDVSISTGNVVMATSGKGIDFSATSEGSGTMTSELFNDYEEGTWVGTLTGGTTDPTTPVTATGRYTKIGRLVTVSINYENVSTAGASGNIGISGLPFANNASVQSIGPTSIYQAGTFTGSPFVRVDTAASVIEFFASVSNAVYSNVTHNAGTGRFIATSVSYTVA